MSNVPEGVDRRDLNVVARRVLLDALHTLRDQADAVTIVGAQAVYLRSVEVDLSVASFTSDADLGLDPQLLADAPLLERAMQEAGFARGNPDQPGSWLRTEHVGSTVGTIAVDLLVPEGLADGGRRSVDIPPHDRMAARRVTGLEAAVVDNDRMEVPSLEPAVDPRVVSAQVAGPAALFIAKAYKIQQRSEEPGQRRLSNKDAGDVVRLMMTDIGPEEVAERFRGLQADERTARIAGTGLNYLTQLFGARAAQGTEMAVAALAGALEADTVRALTPAYISELQAEVAAAQP